MQWSAETLIEAQPETIWAALIDFTAWPQFDPSTERIEGEAGPGDKIKVFSTLAPRHGFARRITAFEAPSLLEWTGGLPFGLLTTVRRHVITPVEGGCRFEISEMTSGPMLRAIAKPLPDAEAALVGFCAGLKAYAEIMQTRT